VPGTGFTVNGNAVARDLLYDQYTNKQFITVQSKDGHTFYIIIDYDKPVDEAGEGYETYFLNLVDDADLRALIDDDQATQTPEVCICNMRCVAGSVNINCPVCKRDIGGCLGREAVPEPAIRPTELPQEVEPSKASPAGMIAVLLLLLASGGGALWYFKIRKPTDNGKSRNALEDYGFDDDDDEYEDDMHTYQEYAPGIGLGEDE